MSQITLQMVCAHVIFSATLAFAHDGSHLALKPNFSWHDCNVTRIKGVHFLGTHLSLPRYWGNIVIFIYYSDERNQQKNIILIWKLLLGVSSKFTFLCFGVRLWQYLIYQDKSMLLVLITFGIYIISERDNGTWYVDKY